MTFLFLLLALILLVFLALKIRAYKIYKAQMIIDKPLNCGYNMDWLAIKSTDKIAIASALNAQKTIPCNWRIALCEKYQTFITPAIGEWTLVLFIDLYAEQAPIDKLLKPLSAEFGEVQYFAAYRNVDVYAWAKYINGNCQRLYIDIFAETPIRVDIGTKESIEYEFEFYKDSLLYPPIGDEEDEYFCASASDVSAMANFWSLTPTNLAARSDVKDELGLLLYRNKK